MSNGFRRHRGDWLLNPQIMDRAVKAIEAPITVDRRHDVPYVAGYSVDGKTIYIDRLMPRSFTRSGRQIKTDRYLILHERIEKILLDAIKGLPYQLAHQIAFHVELDGVKADGVPIGAYNAFCSRYVKEIGARGRYDNVPSDLDLKPYLDEDDPILAQMFTRTGK
ncbi:MAG: hypothetical protein ACREQ5_35635, partial [Candidatus Dormibacteria bacterium]